MHTLKNTTLLTFGLALGLGLTAAHAQDQHDGHHPENPPAEQVAPPAKKQSAQPRGMMQGMDHDKMMQMHDEHMGSGQMDHGNMGQRKEGGANMDQGNMGNQMPRDAEQGSTNGR